MTSQRFVTFAPGRFLVKTFFFLSSLPEPKHALQHDGSNGNEPCRSERAVPGPHAPAQQDGGPATKFSTNSAERADDAAAAGRAADGNGAG